MERHSTLRREYERKVGPYVELIDGLREFGLEEDISLPEVVVIGDQSSGKSSVLETISGIPLPHGTGMVTRCPLCLKMKPSRRDDQEVKVKLSYKDRNGQEKVYDDLTEDNIAPMIEQAQSAIAGDEKHVSNKAITLEIESPHVPYLTLIDLPGIIRTAMDDQPQDIGAQIKRLIQERVSQEETIILAVWPANIDIATTEAITIARQYDPHGERTLGVITKPDLIPDKKSKENVIAILQNQKLPLKKGYTVVRCRGQDDVDQGQTLHEALVSEEEFFESSDVFRSVDDKLKGSQRLSAKLSSELGQHIKRSLPKLIGEVTLLKQRTVEKLAMLGEGMPDDEDGKRDLLIALIDKFGDKMKEIFESQKSDGESTRKHRTFAEGRKYYDQFFKQVASSIPENMKKESAEIEKAMEDYRGGDVIGFTDYLVFKNNVKRIVAELKGPAKECLRGLNEFLKTVICNVVEEEFASFPALAAEIKITCADLQRSALECCYGRIEEMFDMEDLVQTQDILFAYECEELTRSKIFTADGKLDSERVGRIMLSFIRTGKTHPMRENSIHSEDVSDDIGALPSQMHHHTHEVDDSGDEQMDHKVTSLSNFKISLNIRREAQEMYCKVLSYLQISGRRIVDYIPMIIRLHMYKNLSEKIRKRVTAMVAKEAVLELIREDDDKHYERLSLKERHFRLDEAEKRLTKSY